MISKMYLRRSEINRMRELRQANTTYEDIARVTGRCVKTVKRYTRDVIPNPKEKWTPEQRVMQEMRIAGQSLDRIAEATERSRPTVTKAVKHLPITATRPHKIDKQRLLALRDAGYTQAEIAKEFGCSIPAISQAWARMQNNGYQASLRDTRPTDNHASS